MMEPGTSGPAGQRSLLAETLAAHCADVEDLRRTAAEVAGLQEQARNGDTDARQALATAGPRLQALGRAMVEQLYPHATEYGTVLSLMRLFLTGVMPANPVYTGLLWAETKLILPHLLDLTEAGITPWESQPSGQPVALGGGVTALQYAFLELSGPADVVQELARRLGPVATVHVVYPGERRQLPLKRYQAATSAGLAEFVAGRDDQERHTRPVRDGHQWYVDWRDDVGNDGKYLRRAVDAMPTLRRTLDGHAYLNLVSTDALHDAALFDTVRALLPRGGEPGIRPAPEPEVNAGEYDAELSHQSGYSTTTR